MLYVVKVPGVWNVEVADGYLTHGANRNSQNCQNLMGEFFACPKSKILPVFT